MHSPCDDYTSFHLPNRSNENEKNLFVFIGGDGGDGLQLITINNLFIVNLNSHAISSVDCVIKVNKFHSRHLTCAVCVRVCAFARATARIVLCYQSQYVCLCLSESAAIEHNHDVFAYIPCTYPVAVVPVSILLQLFIVHIELQ